MSSNKDSPRQSVTVGRKRGSLKSSKTKEELEKRAFQVVNSFVLDLSDLLLQRASLDSLDRPKRDAKERPSLVPSRFYTREPQVRGLFRNATRGSTAIAEKLRAGSLLFFPSSILFSSLRFFPPSKLKGCKLSIPFTLQSIS
jgi:hypothetical protein